MQSSKDRLYVSTACVKGMRDMKSVLNLYSEKGLLNVEISGSHLYMSLPELVSVLSAFRGEGMNFIFHNYFPVPKEEFVLNLASPSDRIRKKSMALVGRSISLGKKIGARLYSCHPGYRVDPKLTSDGMFDFSAGDPVSKKDCLNFIVRDFMKYYEDLGLESENQDIFVGFENLFPTGEKENYSLFSGPEDIAAILDSDAVRQSNIGLLLDLGHAAISAERLKFDRYDFIDNLINKYGDKIYGVHLSENDGKTDAHARVTKDSWQLGVLKKIQKATSRIPECATRYSIESRGLTVDELMTSYDLVKDVLEG